MENELNPLFSDQTPFDWGGNPYVYFTETVQNPSPKNPMMNLTLSILRFPIQGAVGYKTIRELLDTLPKNEKQEGIPELRKWIAIDGNRGFGEYYEEYDVVAYSGKGKFDRPIAMVTMQDGEVLYFPSPVIQKTVKKL